MRLLDPTVIRHGFVERVLNCCHKPAIARRFKVDRHVYCRGSTISIEPYADRWQLKILQINGAEQWQSFFNKFGLSRFRAGENRLKDHRTVYIGMQLVN
jgi:hypothetical protein